jgi:hypothetical protein
MKPHLFQFFSHWSSYYLTPLESASDSIGKRNMKNTNWVPWRGGEGYVPGPCREFLPVLPSGSQNLTLNSAIFTKICQFRVKIFSLEMITNDHEGAL